MATSKSPAVANVSAIRAALQSLRYCAPEMVPSFLAEIEAALPDPGQSSLRDRVAELKAREDRATADRVRADDEALAVRYRSRSGAFGEVLALIDGSEVQA